MFNKVETKSLIVKGDAIVERILDKDGNILLDASQTDGLDNQVLSGTFRQGTFASAADGSGIALTRSSNTASFRSYSDDGGAVLYGSGSVPDIRGGLFRTLITAGQTGGDIRIHGLLGQLKAYDAAWNDEVAGAVSGRLELVRSAETVTLGGNGISAAVLGVAACSGAITVNTNHILAGVAAISDFKATLTQTGKTAAFLAAAYDTTNWSDATARTTWGYGLLIGSGAVETGISIIANTGLTLNAAPATTGGGLKIHTHANVNNSDGATYDLTNMNEFKGEFVSTAGIMVGVGASYAYQPTGLTGGPDGVSANSNAMAIAPLHTVTAGNITGVHGEVQLQGTLNGAAVNVAGVSGVISGSGANTLVLHMAGVASTMSTGLVNPTAGTLSYYLANSTSTVVVDNLLCMVGSAYITNFASFDAVGGCLFANAEIPNVNTSHALRITLGGTPLYIPVFSDLSWGS